MENIKHNKQVITIEMIQEFKSKYRLATKEDILEVIRDGKEIHCYNQSKSNKSTK